MVIIDDMDTLSEQSQQFLVIIFINIKIILILLQYVVIFKKLLIVFNLDFIFSNYNLYLTIIYYLL